MKAAVPKPITFFCIESSFSWTRFILLIVVFGLIHNGGNNNNNNDNIVSYGVVSAIQVGSIRVNRALFATHSRRECLRLIEQRRITINDTIVVKNGELRLYPGDVVQLDGTDVIPWWQQNNKQQHEQQHEYWKYNKPKGWITTTNLSCSKSIMHQIYNNNNNNNNATTATAFQRRVFPMGRLDAHSTGLLLMTSNGMLADRLLRKNNNVKKEYLVQTFPRASNAMIQQLSRGVSITTMAKRNGQMQSVTAKTLPCLVQEEEEEEEYNNNNNHYFVPTEARYNHTSSSSLSSSTTMMMIRKNDTSILKFTLQEGRNRQIRRMCQNVGLEVLALHRISFANISLLDNDNTTTTAFPCMLEPGAMTRLSQEELKMLGILGDCDKTKSRSKEEQAKRKEKKKRKKYLKTA